MTRTSQAAASRAAKPIVGNIANAGPVVLACVLVAACAGGGGGGGRGPVPQVLPSSSSSSSSSSSGQQPASYNTGVTGIVGSPVPASSGGTPTLATPGGPTFDKLDGLDSFPLIVSSLEATSAGVSGVSSNQGATASFSRSGQFTVLHLDIPGANVHADIDMLTSVATSGAFMKNPTGDGLTWGYDYVLLGNWALPTWGSNRNGAAFVFGYETPVAAMPTTGTATFSGGASAIVLKPEGGTIKAADIWGGAILSVNFAAGTLTGAFTNMRQPNGIGGSLPWNDVSVSASIAGGTNRFSGSTAATSNPNTTFSLSGSATGNIDGAFFGPGAENLGAVWSLSDGTGSALGVVGAGR